MYIAPIALETTIRSISDMIAANTDKAIMEAVFTVGVKVNRYELMKALSYDRKQYEQGYNDGKADARRTGRWVAVKTANNPRTRRMCSECKTIETHKESPFCPHCGAQMVQGVRS